MKNGGLTMARDYYARGERTARLRYEQKPIRWAVGDCKQVHYVLFMHNNVLIRAAAGDELSRHRQQH